MSTACNCNSFDRMRVTATTSSSAKRVLLPGRQPPIALDSKGLFVASLVRAGHWSGRGAFNASAKKLPPLGTTELCQPGT